MRTGVNLRRNVAWCLPAVAIVLGGCGVTLPFFGTVGGRSVSPPPSDPVPLDRTEYVIGMEDQIQVSVWKNPDLSTTVQVRPDGRISVPLLNDVQAAGLTSMELQAILEESLSEYVRDPDVTVIVTRVSSKRFYVMGEVLRPNGYPLNQDMRVMDALALAGGFAQYADKGDIRILRRVPDGVTEYRFDYDAFVNGTAALETNFLLLPGDTIVVRD